MALSEASMPHVCLYSHWASWERWMYMGSILLGEETAAAKHLDGQRSPNCHHRPTTASRNMTGLQAVGQQTAHSFPQRIQSLPAAHTIAETQRMY